MNIDAVTGTQTDDKFDSDHAAFVDNRGKWVDGRCRGSVSTGLFGNKQCSNPGKFLQWGWWYRKLDRLRPDGSADTEYHREDAWWCGMHAPSVVKERRNKRYASQSADDQFRANAHRLAQLRQSIADQYESVGRALGQPGISEEEISSLIDDAQRIRELTIQYLPERKA